MALLSTRFEFVADGSPVEAGFFGSTGDGPTGTGAV
jgi:hypothetical protein